jgi:hypothetical protein
MNMEIKSGAGKGMGGIYGTYGTIRNMYNVFVRKSEGKSSLGKPNLRWKNAIKIYAKATALKAKD